MIRVLIFSTYLFVGQQYTLLAQTYLATYEVHYKANHFSYQSGTHVLIFNPDSSAFINLDFPIANVVSGDRNSQQIAATLGDPDRRLVLTVGAAGTVQWKTNYGGERGAIWTILTDPIPQIDWTTTGRRRTNHEGNTCLAARGEFGGRTYTAWYIPSVPTEFGPLMLHGLPGLIDELVSADSLVHIKLQSIRPTDEPIPTFTDGTPRTPEEHRRQVIKRLLATEALAEEYGARISYPDPCDACEIERGRFSYVADYRREHSRGGKERPPR